MAPRKCSFYADICTLGVLFLCVAIGLYFSIKNANELYGAGVYVPFILPNNTDNQEGSTDVISDTDTEDVRSREKTVTAISNVSTSNLFIEQLYARHGASVFSKFGTVVSTNDDGNYVVIAGDAPDRLAQIYQKDISNDDTTLIKVEKISKETPGLQLLDCAISGDGEFILVSLSDSRAILYTKPPLGGDGKWNVVGVPIDFKQPGVTTMPVAISNNGPIVSASIPNSEVYVYDNSIKLASTLSKPSNSTNFGQCMSMNSNGDRIAVSSDETVFMYGLNSDNEWDLYPSLLPVFNTSVFGTISSISLNGVGDRLCIGQSSYKDDEKGVSGRCLCYKIIKNTDGTRSHEAIMMEPLYGTHNNNTNINQYFGSNVDLAKDGNIIAVASSGTKTVHLYELKLNSTSTWLQIEPTVIKEVGNDLSNFGTSLSLSMDGSILYVGSPTGLEGTDMMYGTTYLYGTKQGDTASE